MDEEEFLEEDTPKYLQVPETIIIQSAAFLQEEDENNVFAKILKISDEFKKAGMTPIYLLDPTNMQIRLITLETIGKTLH